MAELKIALTIYQFILRYPVRDLIIGNCMHAINLGTDKVTGK